MLEKVKYNIIKKINNLEIREYPELILAFVENINDNEAFELLFNYISGYNKINEKIKMTTPIINSEKIEMTSPVISQGRLMAFIMPSSYSKDNIPTPLDSNVKIKTEQKRKLAVIRFGGYSTKKKIKKYEERLFNILKSNDIKIKGNPLLMRYNSPFAPPFIRKNEIGVEID